jgi:hypothetical protein
MDVRNRGDRGESLSDPGKRPRGEQIRERVRQRMESRQDRGDARRRVTWKNSTSVDHKVVAYGGKWSFTKILPPGSSVSYVFSNAGTFLFRCTLHSYVSGGVCYGMCGRVVVQD